jgi:hypothetical protein
LFFLLVEARSHLRPATTLMHSAVEKLGSDLLWRTVTATTIRFGRSSIRFEYLCILFGRFVVPRTLSTPNVPPPFRSRLPFDDTSTFTLTLPRRPHSDVLPDAISRYLRFVYFGLSVHNFDCDRDVRTPRYVDNNAISLNTHHCFSGFFHESDVTCCA